ncbi:MAG: ferredoxin [Anaerolineae bacterium]|nr:ferredoxin [Anaerolineae bacterium]
MTHILHPDPTKFEEIGKPITAEIFRFNPAVDEKPTMRTYVVPYRRRMSVFTLLREIYENMDPTLAFRNQQCGRGICGTCRFRIGVQGQSVKGCAVPLEPGAHVIIKPHDEKKVIRDLVVEL